MNIRMFIQLHRTNNETIIPNKIIVEDCRRPGRADDNCRHNNFIFSSLLSVCLKWILLYETIFLWNNKLLAAYDMFIHVIRLNSNLKEAKMTSRKGSPTPLTGVWGNSEACCSNNIWIIYLIISSSFIFIINYIIYDIMFIFYVL